MENKTITVNYSIVGLLQVAFIILKLCRVIAWRWVWVLAPTWIGVALAIVIFLIIVLAAVIKTLKGDKKHG
jgi:hypothetical protein